MRTLRTLLVLLIGASSLGCVLCPRRMIEPPSPTVAGYAAGELVDTSGLCESHQLFEPSTLFEIAERIRRERQSQPAVKRSILALSGGGSYGAYAAGVLVGWTETGMRPEFDVVTGISTGALIAPLAFLGPEHDCKLRLLYTTTRERDLFRIKRSLRTIFSEAIADNTPMRQRIDEMVTEELLRAVAAEHAKGRRLYIGTTELDSRRQVVWDMGAIAARGTPEDLTLFRSVLLASTSIPGFFPPVHIPVHVDGQDLVERHVDGGLSAAVFFRPPWVAPEDRNDPAKASLSGSDLYIILAGKLYADAEPIKPRVLQIAGNSVSTLIYAQTRGDLMKLYTASILTGMNYHVTALPADFPLKITSTDFNPVEMTKMFEEGIRRARDGSGWRVTPPGLERGEGVSERSGANLAFVPIEGNIEGAGRPVGPRVTSRPIVPMWNPWITPNPMRFPVK